MKIVCIGDSLTYGYGVPRRDTWINILNQQGQLEYINKGVNGDTTFGILNRFYQDVLAENPQLVIIMGGANDFIQDCSLKSVIKNLRTMMDISCANGIIPILGTGFQINPQLISKEWLDWGNFQEVAVNVRSLREWVLTLDQVSGEYIDFYGAF